MIENIAAIGRIMDEREIAIMSIRRPCEQTNFKWQVSIKDSEFRLDWTRGKLKPDFISALESCLGEKVEVVVVRKTNDLASLLS